ncbi:MAG TPA: hypothetical protein VIV60_27745 [Polyangiaceae bacterium]
MAKALVGSAVVAALLAAAGSAAAQPDPTATAVFADTEPASGAPPAPAPAPTPATTSMPPETTGASSSNPPNSGVTAAPPVANPTGAPTSAPESANYDGYSPGRPQIVEPPAPPEKEEKAFELPDFSVRVDPLNWIIEGRLGLELEVAAWKFITVEMVPVFVTSKQPPYLNLNNMPGNMYQKSNGLGALAGTSIGAGFWLNGKPFVGTVLRFYYTNYGFEYSSDIDRAVHTERFLVGMLGSHNKWGPFTIATGLGLGVEMNRERRCYTSALGGPTSDCPKNEFDVLTSRTESTGYNVYGWLHPAYLLFRLSLGFVF